MFIDVFRFYAKIDQDAKRILGQPSGLIKLYIDSM